MARKRRGLALDLEHDVPDRFQPFDFLVRLNVSPIPWALVTDLGPRRVRVWVDLEGEESVTERARRIVARRFLFSDALSDKVEILEQRQAPRADVFRAPDG